MKTVPGRKTDVKDAEWIAELLRHGLIRASVIPAPAQRHLRDLTRYCTHLVEERVRRLSWAFERSATRLRALTAHDGYLTLPTVAHRERGSGRARQQDRNRQEGRTS